jgi:glyoxylase-like metal-dependent hydrolase (beta-lactamase superfamily II)
MKLGNLEVLPVYDGQFLLSTPQGLPGRDDPIFATHGVQLSDDGRWVMDIGAFVVRTGNRVILLDAGAGPGDMSRFGPKPFTGLADADPALVSYNRNRGLEGAALEQALKMVSTTEVRHGLLGESLAKLAIAPGDVTDVVLSHLHFDHIGWVSHDGAPCFPNATYRCERRDADFFLGRDGQPGHDETFYRLIWNAMPAPQRLAPVMNRLEVWDGDAVIAPGVNAMFAPGHTPGSCIVVLSSGTDRALILGDTVHCPLELTDPDFSLMADMDQALADRTRDAIKRELDGGDVLANAPHFPGLRFGRMLPGQGRRGWSFAVEA